MNLESNQKSALQIISEDILLYNNLSRAQMLTDFLQLRLNLLLQQYVQTLQETENILYEKSGKQVFAQIYQQQKQSKKQYDELYKKKKPKNEHFVK